jgi:hypothetical protein
LEETYLHDRKGKMRNGYFWYLHSADTSSGGFAVADMGSQPLGGGGGIYSKGVFGSEGYRLAQVSTNILPSYDGLSVGAPQWTWEAQSTAVRALMRPDSTNRILACWYSFSAVNIDLTINDGRLHRTSVYFVDASGGREQTIEVIDRSTGQTLDSRLLTNFVSGVYLTWDITGNVSIRLTPKTVNAVASAVFFDPSPSGTG